MIAALLLAGQAVLVGPAQSTASINAAQAAATTADANAQAAQAQAAAAMAMAQAAAAKANAAVQSVNGVQPTSGNVTLALPSAPDLSSYATAASVSAAISAATSPLAKASDLATAASVASAAQATANAACKAMPAIPPAELVGGSTGSSGTSCRPNDAANPRITRAAVVTTDSTGSWAITWTQALSSTPVVLPLPVNATAEPIVCNVATRTTTSASGRCWYARALPATITVLTTLVNFDIFGASAANIAVQVLAIPTTQ